MNSLKKVRETELGCTVTTTVRRTAQGTLCLDITLEGPAELSDSSRNDTHREWYARGEKRRREIWHSPERFAP